MIDTQLLIAVLLIGFVAGYGTRDLKSRRSRKRWREKYWYGPSNARIVESNSSSVRSS